MSRPRALRGIAIPALALLVGCDDPALKPFAASLDAWDDGREALEDGRPADAVTAFATARTHDPGSVAIRLWEAKALADAGALEEADARLSELVHADPAVGVAWYNRAAYRARANRLPEAAADLSQALTLGARSALEAADDPDFAAALAHPAFAGILPAQPLEATVTGPDGAVYVGSRYTLEFTISALPAAEISIERSGADPGCLRLQRIVQDDHGEAGRTTRRLAVDLRAEGPCDSTLGPFVVTAGGARLSLDPVSVKIEAPPGALPVTPLRPLAGTVPVPSALAPPDAGFAARRADVGVLAMGRPDRAIVGAGKPPDVLLEWRVDGQTRATGGWWYATGALALTAEGWAETVP
ncbi:MAG: tetratricopeptide repeat protein [Pseudomonadota bacterium]|nr:tetratricopeptide repeat protein [Pseudomonadota bacterium]